MINDTITILGIETSCDETAVAIVDNQKNIHANVVLSQVATHQPYGGVVPELASRAHMDHLDDLIIQALKQSGRTLFDIDAIAVTSGPGLIGGLIVGLMNAKAMASATKKPLIAVNHLEGHALSARLTEDVTFPFLLLLVSGGHCQILLVEDVGKYTLLGSTLDDALGEAFDKTAKMLELGYPGGPAVEARAKEGNHKRFDLPKPLIHKKTCDFSFSGLKTAIFRTIESLGTPSEQDINDVCASFQYVCGDILESRITHAIERFLEKNPTKKQLVVAGGVAANQYLKGRLQEVCNTHGFTFAAPPMNLCTDNGAMIAWAGIERFEKGLIDSLDVAPKARWPLNSLA